MNLNSTIDYTYLKPFLGYTVLSNVVKTSLEQGYRGICVFPEMANHLLDNVAYSLIDSGQHISVVVGFPFGVDALDRKLRTLPWFVTDVDVVANLEFLKTQDFPSALNELQTLRSFYKTKTLKVIIESELLDEDSIKFACEVCAVANINYIKSCSGFHGHVSIDKLKVMVANKGHLMVKASGGIGTVERAMEVLGAGADIIGSSVALDLE